LKPINRRSSFEDLNVGLKSETVRNFDEWFLRYFILRKNLKKRKTETTHPPLSFSHIPSSLCFTLGQVASMETTSLEFSCTTTRHMSCAERASHPSQMSRDLGELLAGVL
jgi:hypothetical protein